MNRCNKYNATPAQLACTNNNLLMLEKLMVHQSNPNMITCDDSQHTTMLSASEAGNLLMIKCLLNENKQYKFTFDWVCFFLFIGNIYWYTCFHNILNSF